MLWKLGLPKKRCATLCMIYFQTLNAVFLCAQMTDIGLILQSVAQAHLTALAPRTGPVVGGTSVQLFGTHWSTRMGLLFYVTCRFNVTMVPALYINRKQVRCVSPASPAGLVALEASNDGQTFSVSGLRFGFYTSELFSLHPSHGPHQGGTLIAIHGQGLAPHSTNNMYLSSVYCSFEDNNDVFASTQSSQVISCISPSSKGRTYSAVRIKQEGSLMTGTLFFRYVPQEHLHVVPSRPSRGPIRGGTAIAFSSIGYKGLILTESCCIFGKVRKKIL